LRKNLFIKVFLDAPYRLKKVLEDVYYILSKNSYVVLCYELTSNKQQVLRGNVKTVLDEVKKINLKGEFILIVDNNFNKNVKQLKKK
jgi:16S rRNA C1402 (ribose-2'-O) methylase RsmI